MERLIKSVRVAAILFATSIASASFGEDFDPASMCGRPFNINAVVGSYSVIIANTLLTSNAGGATPLNNQGGVPGTISLFDDQLVFESASLIVDLRMLNAGERNWHLDQPSKIGASTDDLRILLGCPNSELPRLEGTGTLTTQDGRLVDYTLRLMTLIIEEDGEVTEMIGTFVIDGGQVTIKQVVSLSRN